MNWFRAARIKGTAISGPLLKTKAAEFAKQFGCDEFSASTQSFQKRHSLVLNLVCGEARDMNQLTVDDWHQKLPALLAGYEEKDLANCDETALFYRAIPQKSLSFKGDNCSGRKVNKDRLSILLCAFADGKVKKPLIISEAAKPRCFQNIDISLLPVK